MNEQGGGGLDKWMKKKNNMHVYISKNENETNDKIKCMDIWKYNANNKYD